MPEQIELPADALLAVAASFTEHLSLRREDRTRTYCGRPITSAWRLYLPRRPWARGLACRQCWRLLLADTSAEPSPAPAGGSAP